MNDENVITTRHPSNMHFFLNSADRNDTGAQVSITPLISGYPYADLQRWNDFTITKAQPLVDAFVQRIGVTEIFFPWYIPNINSYNNTFFVILNSGIYNITIPTRFYTGPELQEAIITQFTAAGIEGSITCLYDTVLKYFTFSSPLPPGPGNEFQIGDYSSNRYYEVSGFMKTIGITPDMQLPFYNNGAGPDFIIGSPTLIRYTDYVDIVSNRMHYSQEGRDGISSRRSYMDILCRVYCANDISVYYADEAGTRPFIIHRQFMNPKMLAVRKDQYLQSADFQVLDQYGNLCYIPPATESPPPGPDTSPANVTIKYPDFQLSFIGSE